MCERETESEKERSIQRSKSERKKDSGQTKKNLSPGNF